MLEKVIPSGGQEELVKQAGQMCQVFESSRHIKSAASGVFSRKDLEAHAPPKGKFLSHMITMGSSERYGPNRNADNWPHHELINKHATFVTHGKNYREHANKDPKKALGDIVAEKYDKKLHRGEILMHTDIDKAAAEFEKARKGEEQSGSMAANVKLDKCTACGFESFRPGQRCDCIRQKAGQYIPEKQAYALMDNVDPTFKDYSWVKRPADRIAHYLNYLMPHDKAASVEREAQPALRGDELATMYGMNRSLYLSHLQKIAAWDKTQEDPAKHAVASALLPHAFSGQLDSRLLDKMANHNHPGRVLRSLINRQMVMPLASFHSFVSGDSLTKSAADPVVKEASEKMSNIRAVIIRQLEQPGPEGGLFDEAVEQFNPSSMECCDLVDGFLDKAKDQFALRYEALTKRAMLNERTLTTVVLTPPSKEALALGSLYQAYLCKTASLLEDDWIIEAQLSALH